ncbi:MAG: protein translocase subunit SecF [Deltaproteobacteria bacterium]|nr:protein translocase subunit SecF [Deltaproteobacteria bacterium]MBW2317081.1 protein translocase subunit SecF [Deltaproteobacteria bacterium]
MQIIKPDINIDFIGKRKIAFVGSLLLIAISIVTLVAKGGPSYGIDFAGGTLIQVRFSEAISPGAIRVSLGSLDMNITSVQEFGHKKNEYLIRASRSSAALESLAETITKVLSSAYPENQVQVRRVEMVGPKVGKDLREKALLAMFSAILFIVVYISGRFELKWMLSIVMAAPLFIVLFTLKRFGVSIPILIFMAILVTLGLSFYLKLKFATGAIIALVHDIIITVGVFSLTNKEFTLPIIAALLTIIGYSLNDTIIVFDRIRENTRKHHKQPYHEIINRSINETLSRTLLTSATTMTVIVALFLLGGGIIHDFAFALIIGVSIGTYSSIYVASPVLLIWQQAAKTSKTTLKRRIKPKRR